MASLNIEQASTANSNDALIAEAEEIAADPDTAFLLAEAERIMSNPDAVLAESPVELAA